MRRMLLTLPAAGLLISLGCGSSSAPPIPPAPKTVVVNVNDNAYDPKSVQINRGDTVRWVLVGVDTTHTVSEINGAFDSGFVFQNVGDSFERVFNQNNVTFNYSCVSHGACMACPMKGSVLVGDMAPSPIPGY